jgi:hypothetical protein
MMTSRFAIVAIAAAFACLPITAARADNHKD